MTNSIKPSPFTENQKPSPFTHLTHSKKVNFRKILKILKKLVKFSKLFAKIQLENIENFDENGQLSVFQGKIGQFSKLLFAKIMRNLEEKKKKKLSFV